MIWLRGFVLTPLLFIHRGHCHLHCQSGRWPHPQREVDEGEVEADHTRWPHLHRAEGPGVQTGDQRGDQVWLGSVQVRRLQQAWRDRVQHRHARGWKERLCDAWGRSESQAEEVSFSGTCQMFLSSYYLTAVSNLWTLVLRTPSKQKSPKEEKDIDIVELLRNVDPKEYEKYARMYGITDYRGLLQAIEQLKKEKAEESGRPVTFCTVSSSDVSVSVNVVLNHVVVVDRNWNVETESLMRIWPALWQTCRRGWRGRRSEFFLSDWW